MRIQQDTHGKGVSNQPEVFATPDSLKHHVVVVPAKLRLVTLAAFILWKTKVHLNCPQYMYTL